MLVGVGALLGIVGLICWIIVTVQAFKDSILKGLFCLLCGLYWLYFALFEFKHENKWLIVILAILFNSTGWALVKMNL